MNRRLNTFRRIINTGTVNFIRNASLAVAAMAVMVVTLTIVLFSVVTNATFSNTIAQITNKIDISVYLQDNVSAAAANAFVDKIKAQPDVQKVVYLDKQQALESYLKQNSNNQSLITAAEETGNPIPATIQIYPANLNEVPAIKQFLVAPKYKAMQTPESPSYNGNQKEAIDNITHATNVLRQIGVIAVVVFAVICALIIFNTIQMAIFNRRDEITIMRLLGASTNFIRGPFIVESAIYGLLSAIFSVIIINSAFVAASSALQASSLGLLDINYANQYFDNNFLMLLTLQIAIGIILGTVSATIATHRYLKFKTK
ncbi:MAG TPA: permease-like cell division protein FtsX [Candidatus Saccharimonadales bacterium]|nr:permease-like cell division protein FtsX [Candidatus Saccharimonadales bacterium]